MTTRLETAFAHKVIVSPIGALMENRIYERMKTNAVPGEFRLARAAAAASVTIGQTVDGFLRELGGPTDVSNETRARIAEGMADFAADWHARQDAIARWRLAFWGSADVPNDVLVDLERERRARSEKCIMPADAFGFLSKQEWVPTLQFAIPEPEAALARWSAAIAEPQRLYGPPQVAPPVTESKRVLGPAGLEYVIRFPSPSPLMGDTVYARVFESQRAANGLPTLIYGGGLALPYDQIKYWPAEDYVARPLAKAGFRVVLIESPWHGRRARPGCYSGEPYLARAPVGLFQLYAAQAQETAVLVTWARALGAPAVGVGGISLGAIAAQQVAGHCGSWPKVVRPDMVFLIATAKHIDQIILKGKMSEMTELNQAIRGTGWTDAALSRLSPLLDPPAKPGMPPAQIMAIRGFVFAKTHPVSPHIRIW